MASGTDGNDSRTGAPADEAGAPAGRSAAACAAAPRDRAGRFRALIVDDDFVSRSLLAKMLGPYADCDAAVDGREGLEAFQRAWHAKAPYDLLCLDNVMPEMTGLELLREVRRWERDRGVGTGQGVRVIMATALGDAENVMGALQSGCEAYLVKPIVQVSLLETVRKLGLIRRAL
ncbi:MAG: response regulator [Phycisphaerae bacterium]